MVAFSCSSTKANFDVQSMAPTMCSLPCSVDTYADVEVIDRVDLETPLRWLVALDVVQPSDAVAPEAAVRDERISCGIVGCSA